MSVQIYCRLRDSMSLLHSVDINGLYFSQEWQMSHVQKMNFNAETDTV